MDLNKSREFFDPDILEDAPCHIIGCGAIGSTLAENLARLGISNITLWDDDTVEPHNIANQMFFDADITFSKVSSVASIINAINPGITIVERYEKYIEQRLAGYVFLCVDNIDTRRKIAEYNKPNPGIKAMFDFRMRLTDAQHYATDWKDEKEKEIFIDSMQFSHDEAQVETPISACGMELSIVPTVRIITAYGVSNFMNFVQHKDIKRLVLIDAFGFFVEAM